MKRNSTTFFLESSGAITPVPWVNDAPDLRQFTDPTLSVLRNSFNDYIASGGVIEVIPDPVPYTEPVAPNWDGFNLAFSTLPSLLQAEIVANSNHPSIVGKKDLAYLMIDTHGTETFSLIFPLFCHAAQVNIETRIEWAELAQTFNMPTDFVAIIRG